MYDGPTGLGSYLAGFHAWIDRAPRTRPEAHFHESLVADRGESVLMTDPYGIRLDIGDDDIMIRRSCRGKHDDIKTLAELDIGTFCLNDWNLV